MTIFVLLKKILNRSDFVVVDRYKYVTCLYGLQQHSESSGKDDPRRSGLCPWPFMNPDG